MGCAASQGAQDITGARVVDPVSAKSDHAFTAVQRGMTPRKLEDSLAGGSDDEVDDDGDALADGDLIRDHAKSAEASPVLSLWGQAETSPRGGRRGLCLTDLIGCVDGSGNSSNPAPVTAAAAYQRVGSQMYTLADWVAVQSEEASPLTKAAREQFPAAAACDPPLFRLVVAWQAGIVRSGEAELC